MSIRLIPLISLVALFAYGCNSDAPGQDSGDSGFHYDEGYDRGEYVVDDCYNDDVVYPGAIEICDGLDNNCNGEVDEGVTRTWYADIDDDSYGDPGSTIEACANPGGYVPTGNDCDDSDPDTYPGAIESHDGLDNDCDGEVDED